MQRVNQSKLVFQSKQGVEQEKMDYLTMRLQTFEGENERLKADSIRLKNDNDRLRMVKLQISYMLCIYFDKQYIAYIFINKN